MNQFCLFGGNFDCLSDPTSEKDKTEMRLYFKNTREIDINIFSIMREGIKFFEKKFNFDFPYKKLDIVFVPEFKNVASSFPGGVIFLDIKFIKEKYDLLDINYFKFLLINQM